MSRDCHKCGTKCRDGVQFCSACGAPLAEPALTHKEVANYLATEVIGTYKAHRKSAGKASLFLVEDRFDTFEFHLTDAMAEALKFSSDLPLGDHDEEAKQDGGVVLAWTKLSSMIDKKGFYEVFDGLIRTVSCGCDVLIVCDRKEFVNSRIADFAQTVLSVPRFSPQTLVNACKKFYEYSAKDLPHNLSWARFLVPEDFLINNEVKHDPLLHIHESVMHRLAKYRCEDARDLDTLYAFGDARDWAKDWSADVREIIAGKGALSWNDIEHGTVLVGRHGMGKRAFARSLAKAAGIHLVHIDMPLIDDDHPEAARECLRRVWLEAKSASPCVLLIEGHDAEIEMIEFMFDEFDIAEPVFVLVTHLNGEITSKLLRAGRLERVLEIPVPTARILKEVYAPLLTAAGCNLSEKELDELSKNSQGLVRTLAQADKVVRLAQRSARRQGKPLDLRELLAQIYETPGSSMRVMPAKVIEDTAFHEAGHAVMMLLSKREMKRVTYLSVVPEGNALGWTRGYEDYSDPDKTKNSFIESIRISLGGRAAEELKNGKEGVSSGASSDLESATRTATVMATRFGFGACGSLVSWEADLSRNDELRNEVSTLLDEQYQITLAMLKEHWRLVERLVAAVMKAEEITGDEMRQIYADYLAGLKNQPAGG